MLGSLVQWKKEAVVGPPARSANFIKSLTLSVMMRSPSFQPPLRDVTRTALYRAQSAFKLLVNPACRSSCPGLLPLSQMRLYPAKARSRHRVDKFFSHLGSQAALGAPVSSLLEFDGSTFPLRPSAPGRLAPRYRSTRARNVRGTPYCRQPGVVGTPH